MRLTDPEKLILVMLSDIHEKLAIDDGLDSALIKRAIRDDQTWVISWHCRNVFGEGGETPPEVLEVLDVLEMWKCIETSYHTLSDQDRAIVLANPNVHGRPPVFPGFDGNNETEYLIIAEYLIEDFGRFSIFKGRYLNSHRMTREVSHRMMPEFRKWVPHGADPMTAAQLLSVLAEAIHRMHRAAVSGR